MKKIFIQTVLIGSISLMSCDIFDFNEPDPNPNLSEDAILNSANSMAGWVLGIQRQFIEVHNGYVVDVIHNGADLLLRNYQEV